MAVSLSTEARIRYNRLFDGCSIRPTKVNAVDTIVIKILAHQADYEAIAAVVDVPWYIIAVIHSRESDLDFHTHLHNGDPLTARTTHVPKGRPATGSPPFTFVESAIDALEFEHMVGIADTTIANLLSVLESYNGTGYQHRGINTPYLWSFTNQYTKGKFVADGRFNADAVDKQCGAAALLLRMYEQHHIALLGEPVGVILGGLKKAIPAFLLRNNSFVGARELANQLGGTLGEIGQQPFTIPITQNGSTRVFPAQNLKGIGYIDCADAVAFFGKSVTFNKVTRNLEIT